MRPIVLFFFIFTNFCFSQQIADESYDPKIEDPVYEKGKGPIVYLDEAHHNFHTKDGRYKGFTKVLESDGYVVKPYKKAFTKEELAKGKILVISNALHESNRRAWYLPNPSAFTQEEIDEIKVWVHQGGSLFLIADHMPMAGAAQDLGSTFGFEFTNGFALDTVQRGPSFFDTKEGSLIENAITNGRKPEEKVHQVTTFTGQAFKIPADAKPILVFDERYVNLLPDTAWAFKKETPRHNLKNWYQGAYKKHGAGRIVVFGEAAMFTTQLAGPNKIKVGMNHPDAKQNYQLLLNIIHWLDHKYN